MLYQEPFQWVFEKLDRCVETLNARWFQFDVFGYESIQFTEYTSKGRQQYNWHTDTTWSASCPDAQTWYVNSRKLSVSVALTQQESDYDGGNFQIENPEHPITVQLDIGDAIVFPSFMNHRVTAVTRGRRLSLVAWICGPKFR
jgi:PKHD-type hydroxylase